jgi:hypothetical protein
MPGSSRRLWRGDRWCLTVACERNISSMCTPKRFSRSAAAALAVAVLFLISSPPIHAADGQTLTGAWVVWVNLQPGVRVPMLQAFTSDGLIVSSESFGGLPGATTRSSPLYGVWERTGPHTFATTNLVLVFDASSSILVGFGRARATLSLTGNDGNQGSGTVQIEFLACPSPFACPDPLAANAAWAPLPGLPPSLPVTATRVRLACSSSHPGNHSTTATDGSGWPAVCRERSPFED